jgi:short-subunit dehydrogenase
MSMMRQHPHDLPSQNPQANPAGFLLREKNPFDDAPEEISIQKKPAAFPSSPSPTALITGASSGIGLQLAKRFSKEGYRLILIGRDMERLKRLALECEGHRGIPAVILGKDLAQLRAADEIAAELNEKNYSVDVLVNNAGVGLWGDFSHTKVEDEISMVQLQITFTLTLTKLLLSKMREQGSGKILNVGSVYSFTPVPLQSVYAASKAFLWSFSMSLREELKGTGISVSLLCPGITSTRFRERAGITERKSPFSMSPETVAEIAFRGVMKNKFQQGLCLRRKMGTHRLDSLVDL